MSLKNLSLSLVLVLVLALVVGCAKAPQEAVDAANAALTAAKDAGADRYLANEYNAAQDSLNAAMAEIENQNSKFALTRNYNRAKELLAAATTLANAANEKVAAKRDEVKAEVEKIMVDLQTALADANKLMKKAPRGKEGREALAAMKAELDGVTASTNEVTTLITNGDFLSAKDKLNAGLAKVNSIIEELKQAIAKRYGN